MIKIWFLLILMSVQGGDPLVYKGVMGYNSYEVCMENSILAENYMMDREMKKGIGDERTVWIKSYCLPFNIFKPKAVQSKPSDSPNPASMES